MTKKKQKILIIGGGGREHAIGWKIKKSPMCGKVYFAPGNAGTEEIGENIVLKATDIKALSAFAKKEKIDLTLAIPDDPLALGIVDLFKKRRLKIFGPTKKAARIESSKAYAKMFMSKYNLPTAPFKIFSDYEKAKIYIKKKKTPFVIKASGLALGKGVIIAKTKKEAGKVLKNIFVDKIFGEAGKEVIIEDFLIGSEVSVHAFSDGKNFSLFPLSQDHKRIGEENTGANTGGMGTVAPLDFVSGKMIEDIKNCIITPTLKGMKKERSSFEGVLYPGLMIGSGGPKILEYNARFGDPETETYMRLLKTDLLLIINAIIEKKLDRMKIRWKNGYAATIMLASRGYPGQYEKGKIIKGINKAKKIKNVALFHSGTKKESGNVITNGGRVLGVSATGKSLDEALKTAYHAVSKISFDGMQYRRDIGSYSLKKNYPS